MTKETYILLDGDVKREFNEFLLNYHEFVFNGTKKGIKKFLTLRNAKTLTIRRKYREDIIIPNDKNWFIDVDCLERLNVDLIGESK